MKSKFASLALIALLSAGGTTTALAFKVKDYLEPFGYAVKSPADRTVNIDGGTKYLNVTRLETVQINAGGKSVTWRFDTFGSVSFPFSKVLPGYEGVTVYVAEHPVYDAVR